jgi:uncharacterized repeat protein (TIGR01451 family)
VSNPISARRLTAISGFDQYPRAAFEKADYTLVEDFDELAASLREIAGELCQASVSITKLVDEGDGVFRPAAGWEFTADVSVPGGYSWLQPAPPAPSGARAQLTGADGVATFQWKPVDADAASTVALAETPKPGYVYVSHTCQKAEGPAVQVTRGTLAPNEYAKCTVRNRRVTVPEPPSVLPAPTPGPTPPLTPAPAPRPLPVVPGPADTAPPVAATAPPAPPRLPSTRLRVTKTASRVAGVGQLVHFDLTVRNAGSIAANDVVMTDIPPAALTLERSGARARQAGQYVRGNVVWRFGTLAPGAARSVRGAVRVVGGTPGLKRNLVLVSAENANVARAHSDTRILAPKALTQRRAAVPVTG